MNVRSKKWLKRMMATTITVIVGPLLIAVGIVLYLAREVPDVATLRDARLQEPLRIYSRDGLLLGEFGEQKRLPLAYEAIPVRVVDAFLAAEDHRFLTHAGVDYSGLLRAFLANIRSGDLREGGGTLTMQLARNMFLDQRKTYRRKALEILTAFKIERELSKQEILQLYLNKIFLGQRAYGIGAAAQVYFGKTADQLQLSEIATLAGLTASPSRSNPIADIARARDRRNYVLGRMLDLGKITPGEYQSAVDSVMPAKVHGPPIEVEAPYVAEMVRQQLLRRFGKNLYNGGYRAVTTIDGNLQRAAVAAVRKTLHEYEQRRGSTDPSAAMDATGASSFQHIPRAQAAFVALRPQDGRIIALVGGFDFYSSRFNRAVQARRQPGSALKPFLYSAALEHGYTPATLINDAPLVFADHTPAGWRPQNVDKKSLGPIRLREALVHSRNLASIRILRTLGTEAAIQHLHGFGFPREYLPKNLTLALGTSLTSPLEMASAYAVFANGGFKVSAYFTDFVTDSSGRTLFIQERKVACPTCESTRPSGERTAASIDDSPRPPAEAPRVISAENAFLITDMLLDVVRRGTARRAGALERTDMAGKTGTTNNNSNAWFCGYNADIVGVAWVGFDHERSLGHGEDGSRAALPMWLDFMQTALEDTPESRLDMPPGLTVVRVSSRTGLVVPTNHGDSMFELFMNDRVPAADTSLRDASTASGSLSSLF